MTVRNSEASASEFLKYLGRIFHLWNWISIYHLLIMSRYSFILGYEKSIYYKVCVFKAKGSFPPDVLHPRAKWNVLLSFHYLEPEKNMVYIWYPGF